MFRLRPIRRKKKRVDWRALRSVQTALWVMLALAIAAGAALTQLPRIGLPSGAAQARPSPKLDRTTLAQLPSIQSGSVPAAGALVRHLPAIAIVVDDMGNDAVNDRRAIALPGAVALSFLPYPDETAKLAEEGARAGHEILVHVPMQAEDDEDPGPMALRIDQAPLEIVRRLEWALGRVPGFVGINNHMGSRFTEDRAALVPVVEALSERRVFFFDSRTSASSQVVAVARAFGVPSAARDVFLDDVQKPDAVAAQLSLLEKDARENGVAIAIGHPHEVTMAVLAEWCAKLSGYRLIPISLAIRMKTEREMGASLSALGR